MPITLIDKNFTDIYNNQFKIYTANAGDKITCKFTILEDISIISSPTTFLSLNTLIKTITLQSQSQSFIKEGFRIGDSIKWVTFDTNDNVSVTANLTIVSVSDTEIIYSGTLPITHGQPSQGYTWLIYKETTRDDFKLSLNFIPDSNNTTNPSLGSLIDGEETRFSTQDASLNSMAVNAVNGLIQNGKKSGSFEVSSAKITRKSNVNRISGYNNFVTKKYEVEFEIVNPNILFQEKFKGSNCLKLVALFKFSNTSTDTKPSELYYNENANTGWFDEPYNSGTELSSIYNINMPTLYYNVSSTNAIPFSFEVVNSDFNISNGFQLGASHVLLSDYNKSKKDNQTTLLKYDTYKYSYNDTLPSGFFLNCVVQIKLNSVTNTSAGGGTQMDSVVSGEISFDTSVQTFFEGLSESDRRIIIWVKSANVNHILFDGYLQKKMPVGKEITNISTYYVEENDNDTYADVTKTPANSLTNYAGNIQDNINLFSDFELSKLDTNTSVIAKIVAKNGTGDEFTLDEMRFDLSKQDWTIWGTLYSNRQYNLPNTSTKNQGFLKQKATIDANTKSFRVSYPVMNNWRYWLIQDNASNIFYNAGLNNKNWNNYSLNSLGYSTYYKLEIERNGVFDYKYQTIGIWNYDQTGVFTSNIQLFDADTNTEITSIVLGKKIKVKATHIYNINFTYDGWGDIMIERTESNPTWLISSVVPHQTNTQNPLYPITGNTLTYTIVNATTRTLECYLDTSKLNGNSFSITSKICDSAIIPVSQNFKITEDGIDKLTEDSQNKIIE